jgi:hypothetical protein
MGQYIVKLEGKYLIWSTIVNAPITYGGTLSELRAYVKERDGENGLRDLPARLKRVEARGISAMDESDGPDDVMWLNRAGKNETPLTRAQIVEHYVTQRGRKEPPMGFIEAPDLEDDEPLGWTRERYLHGNCPKCGLHAGHEPPCRGGPGR